MDASIQIIIICCNEERRKFQKKQMEDLNLPYVFFDAYTPKTMGDYITEKHKEYPEADTMICCNRSHIGAIELFVKQYNTKEYCIIMEDDVVLINTFMNEVNKTITLWDSLEAKPIDLISLGYLPPGTKYKGSQSDGVLHWGAEESIWGTQCYMIKRTCAKDIAETLVQKNTTDLYSVLKNKTNYANKLLRIQPDVIITGYCKQGFVWPQFAIEYDEFNSCISPADKNSDRHRFDFTLRKREEFYKPFSMNDIQIIIICCNEERRKFQKKQMEDLNLPYVFFDAYTPKTMGDYITEKYKEHPEADTMICATRSHIGALDFFVKHYSDKNYCIIVEDDVVFSNNFINIVKENIKLWKLHQTEIDYVSLGYLVPKTKTKSKNNNGILYWNLEEALWGQQCYIVEKDVAIEMTKLLVQKNTEDLYSVFRKRDKEVVGKLGYAYKQIRLQPDTIIPNLFRQGFVWPPIAIEYEEFNSCISSTYSNKKRYENVPNSNFYKPIDLLNNIPQPYVINLNHRKDRWQETQEEFKKLDLIPKRIDAVYNKEKGIQGCLASHILALKEGQKTNLPVWISEDDISFIVPKSKLLHLIDEFLKSDGEILCIANNTRLISKHSSLFNVAVETQTTASYIIKPSFLPILLQLWEEVYECVEKGTTHFSYHLFKRTGGKELENFHFIDVCWKILQHYYKFLIPIELYAIQRKSYSDITQSVQDYYSENNITK